jgi:hypothetical protein
MTGETALWAVSSLGWCHWMGVIGLASLRLVIAAVCSMLSGLGARGGLARLWADGSARSLMMTPRIAVKLLSTLEVVVARLPEGFLDPAARLRLANIRWRSPRARQTSSPRKRRPPSKDCGNGRRVIRQPPCSQWIEVTMCLESTDCRGAPTGSGTPESNILTINAWWLAIHTSYMRYIHQPVTQAQRPCVTNLTQLMDESITHALAHTQTDQREQSHGN